MEPPTKPTYKARKKRTIAGDEIPSQPVYQPAAPETIPVYATPTSDLPLPVVDRVKKWNKANPWADDIQAVHQKMADLEEERYLLYADVRELLRQLASQVGKVADELALSVGQIEARRHANA